MDMRLCWSALALISTIIFGMFFFKKKQLLHKANVRPCLCIALVQHSTTLH